MSTFTLRPYQDDVITQARVSVSNGNKRLIIHAPTGAGKTCIAAHLIDLARGKGNKILFLANRRELVFQAQRTLTECGIESGIIMNGEEADLSKAVQIASMQTYVRRMKIDDQLYNPWFHNASIVIVDECHGSISPSYQKVLQSYGDNVVVIGLTATPCRADGRGLGEYYDKIVSSVDIGDLIEQKYLTPVRYFAPSQPDLEKIRTVAGDYDKKQLGDRINTKQLVGDILENWCRLAGGRQTIIFAVNVLHSMHIVDQFQRAGIVAEHIDAHTPVEERAMILERLKSGDVQVISNVGILTEGFDFPAASCIVLARPTKSLGLYLQMAGRGIRTYPGKQDCLLLDHGGCVEQHGLIEWSREWGLDGKEKAWGKKKKKDKDKKAYECKSCGLIFQGESACPDCGSPVKVFGRKVEAEEADLQECKPKKATITEKRIYLGMLKWWQRERGYPPKFINAKYRGRFDCWPHHSIKDVAPIEPDKAFRNKMLSDQIRYAKSKRRAA